MNSKNSPTVKRILSDEELALSVTQEISPPTPGEETPPRAISPIKQPLLLSNTERAKSTLRLYWHNEIKNAKTSKEFVRIGSQLLDPFHPLRFHRSQFRHFFSITGFGYTMSHSHVMSYFKQRLIAQFQEKGDSWIAPLSTTERQILISCLRYQRSAILKNPFGASSIRQYAKELALLNQAPPAQTNEVEAERPPFSIN